MGFQMVQELLTLACSVLSSRWFFATLGGVGQLGLCTIMSGGIVILCTAPLAVPG